MLSRVESEKKKAHADISMKLGKNVREHDKFEYLSLVNRNWPIFKMAVIKSKMAAAKKLENQPYLIIKELVLKGTEMAGGGGVSKTDYNAVLSSNNGKNGNRSRLLVCTTITLLDMNYVSTRKAINRNWSIKISKGAKIRNRYNQVPHLAIKYTIKYHTTQKPHLALKTKMIIIKKYK